MAKTIRAFRGGEWDGESAAWFSTDREHAVYFGAVAEYEIDLGWWALEIDADTHEAIVGEDTPEGAEWALAGLLRDGLCIAVVDHWEGRGTCYYVSAGGAGLVRRVEA